MRGDDWTFKLFKWFGERLGFTGLNYTRRRATGVITKIELSHPSGKTLKDQITRELGKLGIGDPRLPINVLAGMANVVPYNTETTQISTSDWPRGGFFLELEGCWNDMPPMDVRVLSADGETVGIDFRRLEETERVEALEFVREHWPTGEAS